MAHRDGDGGIRRVGSDVQRTQRDRSIGGSFRSAIRRRGDGSCPSRLAGCELNGELIANDHHELHDAEQEDAEQWKAQRQLDGSLATVTVAACLAAFRACR